MRRTFYASTLALVFAAALAVSAGAQTAAPAANAATAPLPLPASDAVLTVDLRRLFTEVVPRALASDSARLAQFNADAEQFRARTGIDARSFETLAVGARIVPLPSGATKLDRVTAVARGRFKTE